jgi:hypothetical protein
VVKKKPVTETKTVEDTVRSEKVNVEDSNKRNAATADRLE